MKERLQRLMSRFGVLEKVLFVCLVLYAFGAVVKPDSGWVSLLFLLSVLAGFLVMYRLARRGMQRAIWGLRNRLIVAYLFIAVVPILLVLLLVGAATDAVVGQMAVYLVNTELSRRTAALLGPAETLAKLRGANGEEMANNILALMRSRFPNAELLVSGEEEIRIPSESTIVQPPQAWKNANGLVQRKNRIYAWAHVSVDGTDVTVMAPLTHDVLINLVPGLGEVNLLRFGDHSRLDHVPPSNNQLDFVVNMAYPFPVPTWESPTAESRNSLIVTTRPSAVLGIVFGQRFEWGERIFAFFIAIALLLMIVELISLVTGIRLTRTITSAVHELYEGTRRVKEGDFTHRIPVAGSDQLAELGNSFNTMTENLGRLIVVAKEKERLQSELEIAREVQAQLFPKNPPRVNGIEITGTCNPARMVSGDYYDFITLSESSLAFAIGDVAGKGISAALLMAAIQSTMRTQLNAFVPAMVAVNGGVMGGHVSTAQVVSQLNRQLYANTAPEKYATFFFGTYDDTTHLLTYTNAGHLPPLIVRRGQVESLDVTGTVVGAFPAARYEERQIELGVGDLLVAYTDGIMEPENVYGEMFGDDRLKEILVKYSETDAKELITRVMDAVMDWTGAGELQDDMTMVVARRV